MIEYQYRVIILSERRNVTAEQIVDIFVQIVGKIVESHRIHDEYLVSVGAAISATL
jgi:hypothetical protein